jgi:glycosyltransferase involved in cell wall biosynthesis
MKILYHHRTQGEEPESVHINSIITALRGLGHEVVLVGPGGRKDGGAERSPGWLSKLKRALPQGGFELLQLAYNALAYASLRRAVRSVRPDLIYERYALYQAAGVFLARQLGLPLILEVNTPYAQAWAHYYSLRFPRLAARVERWILTHAPAIVTVSEAEKGMLAAQGVDASRITVSHNAVDPALFDPSAYPDAKTRLGLAPALTVVGFVGTMNRWQNIPALQEVVRRVAEERSDVAFLLVGDGEGRADLVEVCRRAGLEGRVVFAGRRSHAEIPALVAAMDIALLPDSNRYGSPMKLFEYLAMAKAVVAARVPPVEEVIVPGETGLLVEPGDAVAIAREVSRLAAEPELRRSLGERGRRYVLSRHTWRDNATQVVDLYRGLAGESAARLAAAG